VFHAVEGVHAEWLFQRRRIQSAVERFGVAINPHHRYVLHAERRMFESPRLRAVICVSQMVKREIAARFSIPDDRLSIIYGGIDCTYFHAGLRDLHRQPTRAHLGIPVDASVALFVGSGFARKGVAAYLDTLARIDGLYGIVVGHDKHIDRYRQRAAQLGLEKRVIFTGGIKDVRPYYGASDIFLMPTVYEPFGLTFGEAMACGLPVVASTKAGAADWITEGVSGFVVDPADVSALVSAVNQALARPGMGVAGRAAVMPYTPARITADYAAFYRDLLSR
jgi:UDP-glucose:(heptosyl)LPS alpha-1,3-glucosyltransferase